MNEHKIHAVSEEISRLRSQVNSFKIAKDLKHNKESNIVITDQGIHCNPRRGPTVKLEELSERAFMKLLNCFIELEIEKREAEITELMKSLHDES